jgi:sortase (surface protein transpeptidase)
MRSWEPSSLQPQPALIDLESPAFAARLGELLRASRRRQHRSIRSMTDADDRFGPAELRAIEHGSTPLDEQLVAAVCRLYRTDLGTILPERPPITIEADSVTALGTRMAFVTGDARSLLITYLRLIRTIRHQRKAPAVALRRADIEQLATFLQRPPEDVLDHLSALMGATAAERTALAALFASGAIVIGLAAGTVAFGGAASAAEPPEAVEDPYLEPTQPDVAPSEPASSEPDVASSEPASSEPASSEPDAPEPDAPEPDAPDEHSSPLPGADAGTAPAADTSAAVVALPPVTVPPPAVSDPDPVLAVAGPVAIGDPYAAIAPAPTDDGTADRVVAEPAAAATVVAAANAPAPLDATAAVAGSITSPAAIAGLAPARRALESQPVLVAIAPPVSVVNESACDTAPATAVLTMVIPDISYSCPVYAGGQESIDDGLVTLVTDVGPNDLLATTPGEAGTLWLAAHRTTHGGAFADVPTLADGATITISNGAQSATYRVVARAYVEVRDGRVVDADGNATTIATWNSIVGADSGGNGAARLVLQTCDGDDYRWMIYAELAT